MTRKETRHTNKVLRTLNKAIRDLTKLSDYANSNSLFPKTTRKALTELMRVESNTRIRVIVQDAAAI